MLFCLAKYGIINGRGWFYAESDIQRYDIGNFDIGIAYIADYPDCGVGYRCAL